MEWGCEGDGGRKWGGGRGRRATPGAASAASAPLQGVERGQHPLTKGKGAERGVCHKGRVKAERGDGVGSWAQGWGGGGGEGRQNGV